MMRQRPNAVASRRGYHRVGDRCNPEPPSACASQCEENTTGLWVLGSIAAALAAAALIVGILALVDGGTDGNGGGGGGTNGNGAPDFTELYDTYAHGTVGFEAVFLPDDPPANDIDEQQRDFQRGSAFYYSPTDDEGNTTCNYLVTAAHNVARVQMPPLRRGVDVLNVVDTQRLQSYDTTSEDAQNRMAFYPSNDYPDPLDVGIVYRGSDGWTYTSPQTGVNYILQCVTHGVGIWSLHQEEDPIFVGFFGRHEGYRVRGINVWSDVKTHTASQTAYYMGGEDSDAVFSLYILDLSRIDLFDVQLVSAFKMSELVPGAKEDMHNLFIEEEKSLLLVFGNEDDATGAGTTVVLDINETQGYHVAPHFLARLDTYTFADSNGAPHQFVNGLCSNGNQCENNVYFDFGGGNYVFSRSLKTIDYHHDGYAFVYRDDEQSPLFGHTIAVVTSGTNIFGGGSERQFTTPNDPNGILYRLANGLVVFLQDSTFDRSGLVFDLTNVREQAGGTYELIDLIPRAKRRIANGTTVNNPFGLGYSHQCWPNAAHSHMYWTYEAWLTSLNVAAPDWYTRSFLAAYDMSALWADGPVDGVVGSELRTVWSDTVFYGADRSKSQETPTPYEITMHNVATVRYDNDNEFAMVANYIEGSTMFDISGDRAGSPVPVRFIHTAQLIERPAFAHFEGQSDYVGDWSIIPFFDGDGFENRRAVIFADFAMVIVELTFDELRTPLDELPNMYREPRLDFADDVVMTTDDPSAPLTDVSLDSTVLFRHARVVGISHETDLAVLKLWKFAYEENDCSVSELLKFADADMYERIGASVSTIARFAGDHAWTFANGIVARNASADERYQRFLRRNEERLSYKAAPDMPRLDVQQQQQQQSRTISRLDGLMAKRIEAFCERVMADLVENDGDRHLQQQHTKRHERPSVDRLLVRPLNQENDMWYWTVDTERVLSTVPAMQGASGAPLLNNDGRVVGVLVDSEQTREGEGVPLTHAVTSHVSKTVVDALIASDQVGGDAGRPYFYQRGFMGVRCMPMDHAPHAYSGYEYFQGYFVIDVAQSDTLLATNDEAAAPLETYLPLIGSVIVAVNGTKIGAANDGQRTLSAFMLPSAPGDVLDMTVDYKTYSARFDVDNVDPAFAALATSGSYETVRVQQRADTGVDPLWELRLADNLDTLVATARGWSVEFEPASNNSTLRVVLGLEQLFISSIDELTGAGDVLEITSEFTQIDVYSYGSFPHSFETLTDVALVDANAPATVLAVFKAGDELARVRLAKDTPFARGQALVTLIENPKDEFNWFDYGFQSIIGQDEPVYSYVAAY